MRFVHWFFIAASVSSSANAIQVDFIGPCSSVPLLSASVVLSTPSNVGQLSVHVLDQNKVPYRGSASGIAEAFGAPSGLDATVVISNEEMLSYGWCYSVDGVAPDVYPDQIELTPQTKKIEWFYAYSHYLKGDWISQCVKAYRRPIPNYCK